MDFLAVAEISVDSNGAPWYDISIIPPDAGSCTSLSACQSQTGKTGFNTAMQITPQDNIGDDTCEVLTCEADGCSDGYQYPSDDTKTHTCPKGTSFEVTFCPGGSGTSTSSTTSSSTTSTPTPTTATPTPTTATPTPTTATPTPTTATPTPTPTPTSTPVPTEEPVSSSASSSSSASASGSTGIQVHTENYAGNFTFSSSSNSASADSAGNAGVETATTKSTATTTDSTAVQATGTTTTTTASGSDGAVEVTTKSSDNSTSSLTYIFVIGGCVAGIASGGFIYAVQQKKKALDMETKSPMDNGDRSCRDVSVLVSTPDSVCARL
ncbi:hypothetical protein V7S43_005220 [Phytophthora oleae]|uniref:Carbohydrate-binding protein n=1 Tax=Phytophthora oleae TaxID=2107226 RepID=A0ABD3FSI8_9STRA